MSLKINKLTCTFRDSKNESKFSEYIWQNNYIPFYNKYIPLIFIPLGIFGIFFNLFNVNIFDVNEIKLPNGFFYLPIILGLTFNHLKENIKKYVILVFTYYNGLAYSVLLLLDNPYNIFFGSEIIVFIAPILILAFPNISFLPALIISSANFLICMNLLISNNSHFWNLYIPIYIFLSLVFIKWNNEFSNRENFFKIEKL